MRFPGVQDGQRTSAYIDRKLPDDVTLDEIMADHDVRRKIEASLWEIEAGQGIAHEGVKQRLARWLN